MYDFTISLMVDKMAASRRHSSMSEIDGKRFGSHCSVSQFSIVVHNYATAKINKWLS